MTAPRPHPRPRASLRVAELRGLHGLPASAETQLGALLDVLASDDHAPTPVRDPVDAVDIHLADSLSALQLDVVRNATRILDLGTGAGFPGLPLAIALPRSQVSLLDSTRRKCEFVEAAVAAARLANASVICCRAETWSAGLGAHDLVVTRAIAPQATVLEYAAPLLGVGGSLVEWRGRRDPQGERSAVLAAERLGMRVASIHRVEPFPGARDHHLHVYLKTDPTPPGFPRRPGIARKRPLAS